MKLIGIKIEHGYYKDVTDKFCIVPTAKTEALMRNRGIQFRRTGDGCQWLMAENCNGFLPDDRLECTLQVRDADFMYVTQLDDYRPQSFYRLDLSDENRITDVVSALVPVSDTAGASCFCNINICLTPDVLKEAKTEPRLNTRSDSARRSAAGNTCLCAVMMTLRNRRCCC